MGEAVTGAVQSARIGEGEELLTLEEAVQFLGTSKPTLYRWLAQGEVKGLKVGKQWRFRRADLVAYVQRDPLAVPPAPEEAVEQELAFFTAELDRLSVKVSRDENGSEQSGMALLVKHIITLALASLASDIHLEPVRQADRAEY